MHNTSEVFQIIMAGGWSSIFIVIAAVSLALIGLERFYVLYFRLSATDDKAVLQVRELILKKNYTGAVQICNKGAGSPDLNVLKTGLLSMDGGREAMKSSLAGALLNVVKTCESRLQFLALIASASTILGLLGTITGLIKTFAGLASIDASEKARLLGLGISEAMYSTAAGLVVALAAMVVHTVLTAKADGIVNRTQNTAFTFMSWIEKAERMGKSG